jgi:hypothetical protein
MNENDNCPDCDSIAGVHDLYQPCSQAGTVNLSCGRCKTIQAFRKTGPGLAYSCSDCGWFLGTPINYVQFLPLESESERETIRFELKHLSIDLNQIFSNFNDGHVVEVVRYLDYAKKRIEKLREIVK